MHVSTWYMYVHGHACNIHFVHLDCRKFDIINPTNTDYNFVWSTDSLSLSKPFSCLTSRGNAEANRKFQVSYSVSKWSSLVTDCCGCGDVRWYLSIVQVHWRWWSVCGSFLSRPWISLTPSSSWDTPSTPLSSSTAPTSLSRPSSLVQHTHTHPILNTGLSEHTYMYIYK